jgi:hypothetical protein
MAGIHILKTTVSIATSRRIKGEQELATMPAVLVDCLDGLEGPVAILLLVGQAAL